MGKQSVAGIVVKVTKADIVLLCQDGTFQNVARPPQVAPPLIGERYTHIKKTTSRLKYTSIAAVFLLTFISYLLLPFGQGDSAYVVAIDINPSIELIVNDAMKVIETNANNSDGEILLAAIGMHGDQLAVAMEKIITYSEDTGFFLDEKYLTASVIPVKNQKNQLTKEVEQIIENSISKPNIDVIVTQNNKATYDEAKKRNLSVNYYAYFKELENEGVVKTIKEVKGKSMAELRKMQQVKKDHVDEEPRGNGPKQTKPGKPNSVDPDHEKIKTAPGGKSSEQNKSGKPDSVGPVHRETEKTTAPAKSKAQENKQQVEIRKDVQDKRAPQGQGQDKDKGQDQGDEKNNGNTLKNAESKHEELPKENEKKREKPGNKD